jgi:hypothetical protein
MTAIGEHRTAPLAATNLPDLPAGCVPVTAGLTSNVASRWGWATF